MMAALEARVSVRRGAFMLDADVRLEPGETLALLGPNGAGKSTLLAVLAGLIRPDSGDVQVTGRTLTRNGVGGARDVFVPSERRSVGLLGQRALLFPHLTARQNVAFGLEAQGIRRRDAARQAQGWLDALELGGYGSRKPAALSGGQQQRDAIARALAARPAVLLLDEPMAALDVQTASLVRELLRKQLSSRDVAAIVVTHDVLDAIVLADRVAIMHEGRVIDDGPKERVLGMPRNQFIAALAGVNLLVGIADGTGGVLLEDGRRFTGRADGQPHPPDGKTVSVVFRPSAVRVQRMSPAETWSAGDAIRGSVNAWQGTIAALEPSSGGIRIRTVGETSLAAELSPVDVAGGGLRVGQRIGLTVDPTDVSVHPFAG